MKRKLSLCASLALFAALAATAKVAAHPVEEAAPYLLSEYLKIHDALASDRVEGVVEAAGRIASTASEMLGHTSGGETAFYQAIASAAVEMKGGDLAALRARLGELTAALEGLLRAANAKGWRLFRCSMVKDDWIQADEKVRNPYYGPSMLTCGEPVEAGAER